MLQTLRTPSSRSVHHPQRRQNGHAVDNPALEPNVTHHSRVLIVDDHTLFRRVVREVLDEHLGLQVVGEAMSGEQALAIAAEMQPDVVVLDMHLPDMTGVAITRQLVALLPDVRVVILSFGATDELVVEAMRAGAWGYLSKDIQPEALARAIVGVLAGEVAMSRRTAARVLAAFRQTDLPDVADVADLTPRETEVLRLLAQGATDRQIADQLIIAESTAKKHVQHILRKLRARNRAQAVAKFRQLGQ
jgi:DNA-binding NarL/FixJ family response regulator